MEIEKIRKLTGLNKREFSNKYHIPYRTIQNWELYERECPVYVRELLEFRVKYDMSLL